MSFSAAGSRSFLMQEAVLYFGLGFLANLFTFAAQAVFSRQLAPGEFGILSAALGLVLLLNVPLSAVNQTLVHYLARFHGANRPREIEGLHQLALRALKMVSVVTLLVAVLLSVGMPRLFSSFRPSVQFFAALTVLTLLSTTLSGALCLGAGRFRLWGLLSVFAALLRLALAWVATRWQPWAETALAVTALAWLITSVPVFVLGREKKGDAVAPFQPLLRKDFLLYLAAALSIMLALFLFSSGDQIVAEYGFGPATFCRSPGAKSIYDNYQTAGLLGRSLIWGSAPILTVLFTHVSREPFVPPAMIPLAFLPDDEKKHPQAKAIRLLLLYTLLLGTGAVLLAVLRVPLVGLFVGHPSVLTAHLVLPFIAAMIPLGMLQAIGSLCLATKNLRDCFVLGFGAVVYTLLLGHYGNSPEHMLDSMFGAASGIILVVSSLHVAKNRLLRSS